MKTSPRSPRKLCLAKSTLRALSGASLRRVDGGGFVRSGADILIATDSCDSPRPTYYQDSHCLC